MTEIHVKAARNGWSLWYIEKAELYEEVFTIERELVDRFAELVEKLRP